MTSADRLLGILELFSIDKPIWTVEEAAQKIGVSISTTYRYFNALTRSGLISPVRTGSYTLGPAIIEYDRQIQLSDPMLQAARPVMIELLEFDPEGSIVLMSRLYHSRVMCVEQMRGRGPQKPVAYERGRPMPMFRGATSKIILAHLPGRRLRQLFQLHAKEIAEAGLGRDFEQFKAEMARLRRAGACITGSELDSGRVGVAAPIFDPDKAIQGSLSFVLPDDRADERHLNRLAALTQIAARDIETAMAVPNKLSSALARRGAALRR
jgi:DNA-binding IclR family transcriptional regulator